MKLPFLRKPEGEEPLIVSMTGLRLGDRVLFWGSDAGLLLPLAARAGLSGQALVVSPGAEALRVRAERDGILVETGPAPPDASFDLAVVQSEGDWTDHLGALAAAVRPGGRIIVVSGRHARGRFPRLGGGAAPDEPDTATVIMELVRAGWTRGRSLGDREGLRFVEGVRA